MTVKLFKNFHGVGIGPLSNILAVKKWHKTWFSWDTFAFSLGLSYIKIPLWYFVCTTLVSSTIQHLHNCIVMQANTYDTIGAVRGEKKKSSNSNSKQLISIPMDYSIGWAKLKIRYYMFQFAQIFLTFYLQVQNWNKHKTQVWTPTLQTHSL